MLKIFKNNREELERELLALILNKNDVAEFLQIKPKYLHNKQLAKLLEYAIECFERYKVITPIKMFELHEDFDSMLYTEILTEVFYNNKNWQEQLKIIEESIINSYKEDIIEQLNIKLKKNQIDYEQFMNQIKKLDEIQLINTTKELTKSEILDNINEEKMRINLKKFAKLNETLKLVQGDFLVIGATTGAGKSSFLLNLMCDLMKDYQCLYFNMEMSKPTIYKRLISIQSGIPIKYISNPATEYQGNVIKNTIEEIEKSKIIIEHKINDVKNIKAILSKVKNKNKHTILFIDHLGLTKCENKKSLYEQMTEVAKQLRQICLEYDCSIISASQLNRIAYSSEEISLSMLKDSGELENSASKVILMFRDESSDKNDLQVIMNLKIAKNRDGITGIIQMDYDKSKQIFKERTNNV